MAFLLKRQDSWDIAKKRYCPDQNGTYDQPSKNKYRHWILTQNRS
jgi:hypothetical protein